MPSRWRTPLTILLASSLLIWPAIYNSYPLLYPDSMDYVGSGSQVARALFLREHTAWSAHRSLFYSLAILPLHWSITPWPIITFPAVVTAYVLWLTLRTVLPEATAKRYLGMTLLLTVVSGLGWFVTYIMPDIFTSLLILGVYLLGLAWDRVSPAHRVAVGLVVWFAMVSHTSHLLLAGGLTIVVALLGALQRRPLRAVLGATGRVGAVLIAAVLSLLALHADLDGRPSIGGQRPPFLMARLIADGPGRSYLRAHCKTVDLAICQYVDRLPDNVRDLLWVPNSIWHSAPPEVRQRFGDEEMRVVLGTMGTYPWAQLRASLRNFWEQLKTFGLWNYASDPYIEQRIDDVFPEGKARYLRSRQAQGILHEALFTWVQDVAIFMSILVIVFSIRRLWHRKPHHLFALAVVLLFGIVANAVITGVLSNIEDRYQSRVIWLVPLLASLCVLVGLDPAGIRHRKWSTKACGTLIESR
jgi:hypothetical protein